MHFSFQQFSIIHWLIIYYSNNNLTLLLINYSFLSLYLLSDAAEAEEEEAATDAADEEHEVWDLKEVLPAKKILKPNPTECQGDECDLAACCAWMSNLEPKPWQDCQDTDFGGWPAG